MRWNSKKIYFLLAGLFVLLLQISVFGQQGKSQLPSEGTSPSSIAVLEDEVKEWKEFSSLEGRFTVLMPGVPQEKRLPNDPNEKTPDSYTAILHATSAVYSVWYRDYPRSLTNPSQIKLLIFLTRDSTLEKVKGKLINESDVKMGEYIGLESIVELKEGLIWMVRMFLIKGRFYQVAIWVPTESYKSKPESYRRLATKFFASFKVTLPNENRAALLQPRHNNSFNRSGNSSTFIVNLNAIR